MIYPNYCSVLAIRRFGILVCLTFLAIDLPRALGASFTWGSASVSGSWSNSTQWSPNGVPSISDSATLGNTGGVARVITYDALASGTVGTLSFVQTSSGTNTLLFQGGKDLVDSASLTLAGSSGGVSELRMVSNGLSLNVSAPSLTINSGGLLTLTTGSANTNSPQFNGSVTLSGGRIQASQGVVGSVAQENVGGALSMDSTSKDGWRLHPNKANDWPQFSSVFFSGVDTSSQANFYDVTALYIWKKVDFTGVTESATVKFNPSSILNVTIKKWVAVAKEKAKPIEFRFIVRNGTKYYISEAKYSTSADVMEVSDVAFNLVDFNNNSNPGKRWAAYNPTPVSFGIPSSFDWASVDFNNVTEVGWIGQGSGCDFRLFAFGGFTATVSP